MRTYAISELIERHGAAGYLRALRKRLDAGRLSRSGHAVAASAAYLAARLPARARAMLAEVRPERLDNHELDRYRLLRERVAASARARRATCTLTMIVRNEERDLPAALDSVDALFDEIVICDTGSDDRTVSLARRYGVRIIHDPWRGDFSRPRNRAIDAATGDWIFWMDADDRLEPGSGPLLRRLWETAEPQAAAVCLVNRMAGKPPFELVQVRLFPRREGLRFERRIHEQIMTSARRLGIPFSRHERIRVVHTGYGDREEHRRKAFRNLPMILGALESVPGDPSLRMSLGDTYAVLDNRSAARAAYRSICSDEELYPTNPDIFVQAHVNIALMYLREGNDHEAERYLYRTLYIDPARIEAWFHLGAIAQKRGNEERALALFLRCARTAAPLRMTAVNNHAVRLEAIARIGELLPKAHRYAEAEKVLHEAIRVYPGAYRLHSLLGRVYLDQARLRDAAVWFTRSLALESGRNRAAYEGMARIYELLGDGAQAGQYRRRAATSPAGPTRSLSEGHPAPI